MKKYMIVAAIAVLMTVLLGCGRDAAKSDDNNANKSRTDNQPGIEGYVMAKQNGRILVVESTSRDYSATGGVSDFHNAIWFSNAPDDVDIGHNVQVWFDMVAESYPGQSSAERVELLHSVQPPNADLTEDEAIRRALARNDLISGEVVAILAVTYDADSDQWKVELKQGTEQVAVQVNDSTEADQGNQQDPEDRDEVSTDVPEVPVEALRASFEERLYQEVDEESRKVIHFDTKSDWIAHMSEIMDTSLAEAYADAYYEEKGGELYLISRGGPPMLVLEHEYELTMTDQTHAQVVQEYEDMMFGKYKLTVTYEYRDSRWIIQEQLFENLE